MHTKKKTPKKRTEERDLKQPEGAPELVTGVWEKIMRYDCAFGAKHPEILLLELKIGLQLK